MTTNSQIAWIEALLDKEIMGPQCRSALRRDLSALRVKALLRELSALQAKRFDELADQVARAEIMKRGDMKIFR